MSEKTDTSLLADAMLAVYWYPARTQEMDGILAQIDELTDTQWADVLHEFLASALADGEGWSEIQAFFSVYGVRPPPARAPETTQSSEEGN